MSEPSPRVPHWHFHPFEMAFVGYQNSGKTTLLEKLVGCFRAEGRSVGYLKHDAHGFQMDREGKDTHRLAQAGAEAVFISDGTRQAILRPAPEDPRHCLDYLESDLLLVEGHKGLPLPRIAVLDEKGSLLKDPALEAHPPLALVHPGSVSPEWPDLPRFHRDDVEGLHAFLRKYFEERQPPLRGLVLTGGRSRRMGGDKATLELRGHRALDRAFSLLEPRCREVFVSCRAEQAESRMGYPQIHDALLDHGPAGGILSAFQAHPLSAWLVLACDLPYLDEGTLDHLIRARDPWRYATAFQGHRELPEPLCAIYEPKARARFWQFLALGQTCPRKVLIHSSIALLPSPGRALANVNTPEEHQEALHDLRG